jgi:signal transduction histidine kinase
MSSDQSIQNQNLWLEEVLNRLPIGLIMSDPESANYRFANKAACEMLGQSPRGARPNLSPDVLIVRDIHGRILTVDEVPSARASRGEELVNEVIILDKGAHRLFVSCNSSLIPPMHGQGATVLVSFQDVSDLKIKEANLEAAKDEAERANEIKSAFLANMSHEIRTPLGAMLGFADLLRDADLSLTERTNYIDIVSRNGEQLSVIINDILDLSKVEAGHLTLEYTDTHVRSLVEDVVSLMGVKAKEKDLTLEAIIEKSMPDVVISDPTRVRQVLLNLVSNAIKFTKFGSVSIHCRVSKNANGENEIQFDVRDTGIGIPESQQEKIFEVFVQADGSMTRRFGGTGLGLALSRRLARALGGDVSISKSVEGVGTTFTFTFLDYPLRRVAIEIQREAKLDSGPIKDDALSGVKVLVIDDAPDNQQLIWRYLTKKGALVDSADNGLTGYRKALMGDFDIVLMDIQMPEMDGYTATQKLRAAGYSKPIIALTAHAMSEVRKKALNVGCTDHLPKPINQRDLVETIAKYVPR